MITVKVFLLLVIAKVDSFEVNVQQKATLFAINLGMC